MGAQLRVFRRRIKSVQATKKITKAMELIASSRIVKAQQRVDAASPYTRELTRAISSAASTYTGNHPLLDTDLTDRKRAAILVIRPWAVGIRSASHKDLPTFLPVAARKVLAMPPPTIS